MTEKEVLFSRYIDKRNEADEYSMITNTNFLSVDERDELVSLLRRDKLPVKVYFYGGFFEAERCVAVFVPEFYQTADGIVSYFDECHEDNPLCAVRAEKDKFTAITHRDYLGALMGLGIKREMLGDILTDENGAYIICFKSIAGYICENLTKSGRASLQCSVTDVSDIQLAEEKCTEKFHSVASLRLDNLLSAGFNMSRTKCTDAIIKGIVYVNSFKVVKPDMTVRQGDKIVLRGKGKVVLSQIIGENRKGRINIVIKHFN